MKAPAIREQERKSAHNDSCSYQAIGEVEHGPAAHPEEVCDLASHKAIDEVASKPGEHQQEPTRKPTLPTVQSGNCRHAHANSQYCVERNDPLLTTEQSEGNSLVHCQYEADRPDSETLVQQKVSCYPFRCLVHKNEYGHQY
jgi:hypothetical protein